MPLIPEEIKRRALMDHGYDPDKYQVDDGGYITPKSSQPSVSTDNIGQTLTVPEQRNVSSATTVAAKSALSSLIPSLGGIGSGALAAEYLPFAHVAPPWSEIAAGLVGGIAGGYGVNKLQEAVVPDSIQQKYFPSQQEVAEHPYANIVGSTIPALGPFSLSGSLRNLAGAGKLAGNIAARGTITDAQQAALKALALNTAVNAGTGAGLNVAHQLQGDEPFDYGKLALETGLAGLINQPRKPFQRFFGDSSIPRDPAGVIPPDKGTYTSYVGPEQLGKESKVVPWLKENMPRKVNLEHEITPLEGQPYEDPNTPIPNAEPVRETSIPIIPKEDIIAKLKAEGEAAKQRVIDQQAEQIRLHNEEAAKIKAASDAFKAKLIEQPPDAREQATDTAPPTTEENPVAVMERQFKTSREDASTLAAKRGLRLKSVGKEMDAAGEFIPGNREINVGKAGKRGGSTIAHETTHGFMLDLAQSQSSRDHALLESGFKAAGQKMTRQEYLDLNNRHNLAVEQNSAEAKALREKLAQVEEPLADAVGRLSYGRFTYKDRPLRQWGRDVLNHLKVKTGTASPEEALSSFSAAMHREAPYGSRAEHLPLNSDVFKSAGGVTRNVNQKEDKLIDKHDDAQYYKERLENPELLDKAIPFEYANGSELAVPVGGKRKSGIIGSAGLTIDEAKHIASRLQTEEGFPNPTINSKTIRGKTLYSVQWGEPTPTTHTKEMRVELGRKFGYKESVLPLANASDYTQYKAVQDKMRQVHEEEGYSTKFKELMQQSEDIKNRHGGFPPAKPVEGETRLQDTDKPIDESRPMYLVSNKLLQESKPLGLNPDSKFPAHQLDGSLKNKIPPFEYEMLKDAGLDKFLAEKKTVTPKELNDWIKENGPRTETHTYGMEGKVSEAKKEYDRMTHEMETSHKDAANVAGLNDTPERMQDLVDRRLWKKHADGGYAYYPELDEAGRNMLVRYNELKQQIAEEPRDTSPRATQYYSTVSPLPTTEPMPEWTKTKSGKNVQRVDVVIPHKLRAKEVEAKLRQQGYSENAIQNILQSDAVNARRGNIAGLSPEVERPLWQPDNLHENLPNTLGWAMIQYKTGPNGEKIAVIAEAQSRWGQDARKMELTNPRQNHPLLKDYNRLILKAAIDQARKEGATHIMVSDAETAMMTEGHDLASKRTVVFENPEQAKAEIAQKYPKIARDFDILTPEEATKRGDYVSPTDKSLLILMHKGEKSRAGTVSKDIGYSGEPLIQLGSFAETKKYFKVTKEGDSFYIDHDARSVSSPTKEIVLTEQEPGMRLNYDTILPKIAEELTGSKGERVSLGEHKNAVLQGNPDVLNRESANRQRFSSEANAEYWLDMNRRGWRDQDRYEVYKSTLDGKWYIEDTDTSNRYRENLIFKNPDDTPKTDVSGRLYDISNIPEQFSLTAKRFQETDTPLPERNPQTETPEFKKWFGDSKVVDKEGKPLVVYHGTDAPIGFHIFRENEQGIHFGNIQQANDVTKLSYVDRRLGETVTKNAATYPVYLNIKHPKYINDDAINWEPAIKKAKQEGYDGIIYDNQMEGEGKSYIAFHNNQIKSATGNSGAFDGSNPDIRYQDTDTPLPETNTPRGIFKLFSTDLDMMHEKGGDFSKAAHALSETRDVTRQKIAKFQEPLIGGEVDKLNGKQKQELYQHMLDERYNGSANPITTGPLAAAYEQYKSGIELMHEDQRAANQPVKTSDGDYRLPISREEYIPNVPSHKVMETITTEGPGNAEWDMLHNDFIEHYLEKGKTAEEAADDFKEIKAQYGGSSHKTNYGAVRREMSVGLPKSWIEPDFMLATKRYINRFARDRAWFDTIESKEELNKLFGGHSNPFGVKYESSDGNNLLSDPVTRRAASQVAGFQDYSRKTKMDSLGRPIAAGALGPLTGVGDVISTLGGMLKYVKPHQIPQVLASYTKALDKYKTSVETGLNQRDSTSVYEMSFLSSSFEDKMNELANLIYKFSGRQILETASRSFGQAAGETIATIKLQEARNGDSKAESFLKMLANNRDYSELSVAELGTRIAQRHQGTYDLRQLPYWAIDSSISPFLKLARWNIGQTNEFAKSVVNSALKGDIAPLISSLFGSVAAGYIIKQLREDISNKKDPVPSLSEIAEGGKENKLDLYAWNVAGATAYAGFGGMLGDLLKAGLDAFHGNKPQGFTFPTVDLAADVASRSFHAAEAIKNGEDVVDVALAFNKDMAKSHIQALRLVLNNLERAGVENDLTRDFKSTEARNDLRRFKQVEGEDISPYGGGGLFETNPYEDLGMKKFKRTDSIQEAIDLLPNLISGAIEKSNGDPYKLKQELQKLKANSYQTMPNPQSMPLSFANYIQYLAKTQGKDVAAERLNDYLVQNRINKVKSSVVPPL